MKLLLNLRYGDSYMASSSIVAGSILDEREPGISDENLWDKVCRSVFAEHVELELEPAATIGDLTRSTMEAFGLRKVEPGDRESGPHARFRTSGSNVVIDVQHSNGNTRNFIALFLRNTATSETLNSVGRVEGEAANENSSLQEAGLQDGDVIEVLAFYQGNVMYHMEPTPSAQILMDQFASESLKPPPRILLNGVVGATTFYAQERVKLFAALLYTNEDVELAKYVREHFPSLNELSGTNVCVFIVERKSGPGGVRYWKDWLSERFYQLWSIMGWIQRIPYDKNEAYRMADLLGIDRRHLPCLVVFDRLDRLDKLVFPIEQVSPKFFRALFQGIHEALADTAITEVNMPLEPLTRYSAEMPPLLLPKTSSEEDRSHAFESVTQAFEKILSSLRDARDNQPSKYEFYGQTVYIANPTDTTIADFMNQYGGSSGPEASEIREDP